MDIHWIDFIIGGTLTLMFAFSCWKGFIKEAFALGSLFLSILLANQFDEMLAPYLSGIFSTTLLSEVAAFILIFIFLVIFLRFIGNLVQAKFIDNSSALTFLNRVGGGALGLMKGMLILIVLLILIMNVPPAKDFVYDNSKLVGYVESSAVLLTSITTGDSLAKKVRDQDGFFGDLRRKSRKVYKNAQKKVTEATTAVIKSEAIKAVKKKTIDAAEAAKDMTISHKDVITEKDRNELNSIIQDIAQ